MTAEVGKVEEAAKKAKDAGEGIAKLNFKQAAAGAAQAFELLNQKLKITDSEFGAVVGSAVKFGAMGAQMAGPWGAAAGAVVGALLEIDGVMDDVTATAQRLADALKTTDQRIAELTAGTSTLGGQLKALTTGAHSMAEAVELVTTHLQRLHDAQTTFVSLGPVLKAVNDQLEAQKRILGEINGPRDSFAQSMVALDQLFKNGTISATDYVRQQSELIKSHTAHEGVVVGVAKAYERVAKAAAEARNVAMPQFTPTAQEWNIQRQPLDSSSVDRARDMANAQRGIAIAGQAYNAKQLVEQAKAAKELEASIGSIDSIMKDSLVSSAQQFSSALVDAANGADVSWTRTFESILTGLQKAIVQAMILKALTGSYSGTAGADGKAIGGLFGLAGFASGGMIMPGGSGGTDSQVVMFRKSPEEAVRIHTPAQEAAYARGASGDSSRGRTTSVNVPVDDSRALLQSLDGPDGDRIVLNVIRRNPGAFRSLLGR